MERTGDNGNVAVCVGVILVLSGKRAVGPSVIGCTLFVNILCVGIKKCLEAPESGLRTKSDKGGTES